MAGSNQILQHDFSAAQAQVVSDLHTYGSLVKYSGGFWSAKGVELREVHDVGASYAVPIWWRSTSTIRALMKQGVVRVVRSEKRHRLDIPVEIELDVRAFPLLGGMEAAE